MAINIKSTRDLIIRTPDLAGAVAFYRDVVGFRVASSSPTMVGLETGAFMLYLEPGAAHGPVGEFLVADVAATKEQLLAAGCVVLEEDGALPRCYLRDPFGFVFNLGRARDDGESAARPPDLKAPPFRAESEREMRAPPPVFYRAFTVEWERWFAAPGTARVRPVIGVPWYFETLHAGERHPHYGRYLRLESDTLVELTWLTAGTLGAETLLTVELLPRAGGTLLKLTHAGFPDENSRRRHADAWPQVLAQLDRVFATQAH